MSRNPNQHRGLVPSQHFRNPFDPEPEIDGLTKWESEHKGLTYRVRYTYYSDVNGQIVRRVIETEEADRWIEDFDIDNFNRTDPPVIWWDQGADGSIDSLVQRQRWKLGLPNRY